MMCENVAYKGLTAFVWSSAFILFSLGSHVHAAEYDLIHLETLRSDDGGHTFSRAVSGDGNVIVGNSTNDSGEDRAFLWTSSGMTDLGTFRADNGGNSYARGVSSNGSVIVGNAENDNTSEYRAFRWTSSGMDDLGTLRGDNTGSSVANGVSANGAVVIGAAQIEKSQFFDVQLTVVGSNKIQVISTIRRLTGMSLQNAKNLADNPPSIVGSGLTQAEAEYYQQELQNVGATVELPYNQNGSFHAFRWINGVMTDLGDLTAQQDGNSYATAVSFNGDIVVGSAQNDSGEDRAFRWTSAGMDDLGTLRSNNTGSSAANGVSYDGNIVVGSAINDSGDDRAFRWTSSGMDDLGTLRSDNTGNSLASSISGNGNVIVGYADNDAGEIVDFRWTTDGMKSIQQILADAHIDTSGINFDHSGEATPTVNADGSVIIGHHKNSDNEIRSYIFMMNSGGVGITTPEEMAKSMVSNTVPAQQAQSTFVQHTGQSLAVARNALQMYLTPSFSSYSAAPHNISPAAGNGYTPTLNKAAYVTGSFGAGSMNDYSNHNTVGSTGMLFKLSPELAVGVGVLYGYNREETYLKGSSRTHTTGLSMMSAYEPEYSGLRLYGLATAAKLDIKTDRRYLNGGTMESARGDTDGVGYGLALRAGYVLDRTVTTQVMPYVEADVSHTRLDAYREQGGVFAGQVDSVSNSYVASRIGAEISHPVTDNTTMRGRAAWGHRYSDGGSVVSTVAGLSQGFAVESGNRNWVEMGVNVNYRMTDKISLTGDLTGRIGRTSESAASAVAGVIWNF